MLVMASMTAGFLSVVRFVLEDWREHRHPESLFPEKSTRPRQARSRAGDQVS
jgi:hypothetical protein